MFKKTILGRHSGLMNQAQDYHAEGRGFDPPFGSRLENISMFTQQ